MDSKLDEEWINLMLLAKQIGLTPAEVKEFLKQQQEYGCQVKKGKSRCQPPIVLKR